MEEISVDILVLRCHVLAVFIVLVLGIAQFIRVKKDKWHKRFGWLWLSAIWFVALSSFGINRLMPTSYWYGLSPSHFTSVLVMVATLLAVFAIRSGDIQVHKRLMLTVYLGGIILPCVLVLASGYSLASIFTSF